MKLTAIFMTCGTALAAIGFVFLRFSSARAATPGINSGHQNMEGNEAVPISIWEFQAEEDFSPDAFRDELLK